MSRQRRDDRREPSFRELNGYRGNQYRCAAGAARIRLHCQHPPMPRRERRMGRRRPRRSRGDRNRVSDEPAGPAGACPPSAWRRPIPPPSPVARGLAAREVDGPAQEDDDGDERQCFLLGGSGHPRNLSTEQHGPSPNHRGSAQSSAFRPASGYGSEPEDDATIGAPTCALRLPPSPPGRDTRRTPARSTNRTVRSVQPTRCRSVARSSTRAA